jgi:hypothetical protein
MKSIVKLHSQSAYVPPKLQTRDLFQKAVRFILYRELIRSLIISASHKILFVCFLRNSPTLARATSCSKFLNHTQLPTTVGRTPLDEGSARRRDLYLTHSQETDTHAPIGIQTRTSSKQAAVDPRLRPLAHWNRHQILLGLSNHGDMKLVGHTGREEGVVGKIGT